MAAEKQGKFWEFHDKLFANQKDLTLDAYKRYARELKLDVSGAKPYEEFATAINAELSRLKLPVPAGAPAG